MEPYLLSAIGQDNEEATIEEVIRYLLTGDLTLWLFFNSEERKVVGAGATNIAVYTRKRTLDLRLFACDAPQEEWLPLLNTFEEWARFHGCKEMELTGRKAWAKILPNAGFKQTHVTMTKTIQ